MLGYNPPGCGPGDPIPLGVGLKTPQVWAWRPPLGVAWRPPGCGPEDLPGQTPQLPPWVWAWRAPQARSLNSPPPWLWVWKPARHAGIPPPPPPTRDLLQGMLGYHLQCLLGYHPPPPVNRITDMCKNITLPQLRCGR